MMQGTPDEGITGRLFEGKLCHITKCINVRHTSSTSEVFSNISLDVKFCNNVYDSFDKITRVERMDQGYRAEGHGCQVSGPYHTVADLSCPLEYLDSRGASERSAVSQCCI